MLNFFSSAVVVIGFLRVNYTPSMLSKIYDPQNLCKIDFDIDGFESIPTIV